MKCDGQINVKGINFSYPTRPNNKIMSSFSINILPGETIALVGESGQGKSTLLHLIQRFYDISGGEILLDGVRINELNIKWLRSQIGLVSQERSQHFVHFKGFFLKISKIKKAYIFSIRILYFEFSWQLKTYEIN